MNIQFSNPKSFDRPKKVKCSVNLVSNQVKRYKSCQIPNKITKKIIRSNNLNQISLWSPFFTKLLSKKVDNNLHKKNEFYNKLNPKSFFIEIQIAINTIKWINQNTIKASKSANNSPNSVGKSILSYRILSSKFLRIWYFQILSLWDIISIFNFHFK